MKKITIFTNFLYSALFLLISQSCNVHSSELFIPNLNSEKNIKIELSPKQYSKFIKNMYRAAIGGHDDKKDNNNVDGNR